MAPTIAEIPQPRYFHLFTRASDPNYPSLTSLFAVIINRARNLAGSSSNALARSISNRNAYRSAAAISKLPAVKREQQILVIPTTYANLNNSPKPGAVAGITLGAVLGFLLALTIMILIFRSLYGGDSEVVEEEIITKRSRRSHAKKQSSTASSSSDGPPIPIPVPIPEVVAESRRSSRRQSHVSRRTSRMSRRSPEQVIVEEELSSVRSAPRAAEEVIVVEEESTVHSDEHVVVEEEEEDIVEVIEEHSPEPPPRRRSSAAPRRSGAFRTVDPAEYGGGDAPSRRISRNTNRG